MDTFTVADFAHSVFFYAAAGTVVEVLRTVFHADTFMLDQTAVIAAAAGDQQFFQQPVAGGFVTVGIAEEFAAEPVPESF